MSEKSKLSNNPSVIRDVIKEIIEKDFSGNVAQAADEISVQGLARTNSKRHYSRLTTAILYNLVRDKSQIKFSHLEIICNYLEVPVGVFLLFTRLRASKRDGDEIDIRYLKSVVAMIADATDEEVFDLDLLREIGSGNKQLNLEL